MPTPAFLPETNEENNRYFGVHKIYDCKQSSATTFGECYGYTTAWGLNGDAVLLAKNQKNLEEIDETESIELPLTRLVSDEQFGQFLPTQASRKLNYYLFDRGLSKLIDDAYQNLSPGGMILINCQLAVGGHAIGFKKINDKEISFFDCNKGKYEAPNLEHFKLWLGNYLRINYKNAFYGYFYDEVKQNNADVSMIKNFFSTAWNYTCKIVTSPLGIPRFLSLVKSIIVDNCNISDFVCRKKETKKSSRKTETIFGSTYIKLSENDLGEVQIERQKEDSSNADIYNPNAISHILPSLSNKPKHAPTFLDQFSNFFGLKTSTKAQTINQLDGNRMKFTRQP